MSEEKACNPEIQGCELCGDFPVVLCSRCHTGAPLRVEMHEDDTLVLLCFLPECGREVARFKIDREPVH